MSFCITDTSGNFLRVPFNNCNPILSKYPLYITKSSPIFPIIETKNQVFCNWDSNNNRYSPVFNLYDGEKIIDEPTDTFCLIWNNNKSNNKHPLINEYIKCSQTSLLCSNVVTQYISPCSDNNGLMLKVNEKEYDYILHKLPKNINENYVLKPGNFEKSFHVKVC